MKLPGVLYFTILGAIIITGLVWCTGCAQIGMPTGGSRDSIPPRLLKAVPELNSTGFTANKITLTFDEYVNIEDVQNNVLVSPFPAYNPVIDYKLKTVTVKLKDTLRPNTTYSINFGNAIRDNNENNPLKNFTYVFSTGKTIDSLTLEGKVIIAETGKADSTLITLLYRSADDSAVQKRKPDYIARLRGDGSFNFTHLSPGNYKIYALKDGDGGKTYNAKVEQFAFADRTITISRNNDPVILYAYAETKDVKTPLAATILKTTEKKLKYTSPVISQSQELEDDLELNFNRPLKKFDPSKIILTDTAYKTIPSVRTVIDSTRKKISLFVKWKEETKYRLIINADAAVDSSGINLVKTDTLRFTAKKEADYGNLVLRFSGLDLAKHPVVQFVQNEELKAAYPITANEWNKKLFKPGEYDIRILFDDNNNGKWDPGSYYKKRQPEKVIALPQKLSIRANWDNERDIKL